MSGTRPDEIVALANKLARLLSEALPGDVSFTVVLANSGPADSFGHWITNTDQQGAETMLIRALQEIHGR